MIVIVVFKHICRSQTHDFNKEESFSASGRGSNGVRKLPTDIDLWFAALNAEEQLVFVLT